MSDELHDSTDRPARLAEDASSSKLVGKCHCCGEDVYFDGDSYDRLIKRIRNFDYRYEGEEELLRDILSELDFSIIYNTR